MNWHDVFDYDGLNLRWKAGRTNGRMRPSKMNGKIAGCKCKTHGYVIFNHAGKTWRAHRVIWEMHHGSIPEGMEIDHINHKRDDNRILNLRLVSTKINAENTSLSKNNSSGYNGVFWNGQKDKWQAKIKIKYRNIHLGFYSDWFEAVCARASANVRYGFHGNHGRRRWQ